MSLIQGIIPKRGKAVLLTSVKSLDFYKFYIKNLQGNYKKTAYDISNKRYTDILKKVNAGIMDEIIFKNFEYDLPCRFGKLSVIKTKVKMRLDDEGNLSTKNLSVDYKATLDLYKSDPAAKEAHIKVYHENEHSDEFRVRWHWVKNRTSFKNHYVYLLIPSRNYKRYLAKCIKENKLEFFERNYLKFKRKPKTISND